MAGKESPMAGPPRRSLPALPSPEQGPSSLFCPGIGFGILITASISLKCILIFLILSAPQGSVKENNAQKESQVCLDKCIPCRSAENYVTASLTLDPNTAHPHLYVSEDLKSVQWRATEQDVMSSPIRYNVMASVLSQETFTSGRICWEVEVLGPGDWWAVGIVRESANRQGGIFFAPQGGYWAIQRIEGKYEAITHPQRTNLSICHAPTRISVLLDFPGGQVAFFDGDTNEQLFAFPRSSFLGDRIRAFFLVYKLSAELMLHP